MRSSLLKEYNLYMVTCDYTKFQPVSFYMEGRWIEVHPSTYILNVQVAPPICVLGFQAHADETFILGAVFLRNYYTVFDMEYSLVGLGPHANSLTVLSVTDRTAPSDTLETMDWLTLESIGHITNFTVFILLVILVSFIISCCKGETWSIEVIYTKVRGLFGRKKSSVTHEEPLRKSGLMKKIEMTTELIVLN